MHYPAPHRATTRPSSGNKLTPRITRLARAEGQINTHMRSALARVIFAGLAMTGYAAIAEDNDNAGIAAKTGSGAEGSWPIQEDVRFDINALNLNVYGLSYHPDREAVHRLDLGNQVNPGLGLHYVLDQNARGVTFVELGGYYDSGRSWAKFIGLGYQFKVGKRWRVGGALAAMHSQTYNDGIGFVGMIPLVTYDLGRVTLNAAYYPKFGHYNEVAAFGFYISIPFGKPGR